MEILRYPHEILRKKSLPIKEINATINELAQSMLKTMDEYKGLGLAGPQVGQLLSIFTACNEKGEHFVFINPEIIGMSVEKVAYEEGCLSLPGVYEEVIRPECIAIQAWNEKGKFFKMEQEGLLARVIQHEMDHLKGILFFDYLSALKQKKLLQLYEKQSQK